MKMKKYLGKAGLLLSAVLSVGGTGTAAAAVGVAAAMGAALSASFLSAALLSSCELVPSEQAPHSNTNDPDSPDYDGPALPVAVLTGLPDTETYATSISVTVGGTGITSYVYSLDGSAYSGDTPVSIPITASALELGAHSLSVLGKNADGWLQWESRATTYAWTILEQTDFTPPDMIDMNAFAVSYLVASAPGASLTVTWEQPAEYVLVVRSLSDINGDLPVNGTAYAAGDAISGSTVVYVGNAAEIEETEFPSDGTWRYRAFAYDEFYNYAGSANQVSIVVYKDAVYVHYQGSNSAGNGTSQAPLRTIQAGIDKAVDLGHLYEVRVAGASDWENDNYGTSSPATPVVTMASGVSIRGGYDPASWAETARDPDTFWSYLGYKDTYTGGSLASTIFAATMSGAVTIDGFRIAGCTASNGTTIAVNVDSCAGGVTISRCHIQGGVNEGGGASYGIKISASPATISNNFRIWGGSTPGGSTFGIHVSGSDSLTISGNNTGIDCVSNLSNSMGNSYGIYLTACSNVVIENSTVMSTQDGVTGNGPCGIAVLDSTGIIRNCRVESAAAGTSVSNNYALYLDGTETDTVIVYNCHIMASGSTAATGETYGIYAICPNLSLYNNNIGAGPGGSVRAAYALYLSSFNPCATQIWNNNIFCVVGAVANFGIYEASAGTLDGFGYNNFIQCTTALYYNYDTSENWTIIGTVNLVGQANINFNNTAFDRDGHATIGESDIDEEGADGAAKEPPWPFTSDKDGATRTGNGSTGWSIGPYEYD